MTTVTFDTLKFANQLKAAGVSTQQAEAQASALADALDVNLRELATKSDLRELERSTKSEFTLLRQEMIQLEQRMTIKIGTTVFTAFSIAVGVIAALFKLFLG
ncbi:MAG: CCDC90 family protein [Pseudomonadales bacterium]|jgi:hypothetical protein|nr:CCDC90 family protein [Pseudomonadales bacterium]